MLQNTTAAMTAFREDQAHGGTIANDWKAIRDRMQQIKAEESAFSRPCPQCKGRGWIPDHMSVHRAEAVCVCDFCQNPDNLPPTGRERRGVPSRVLP
jgi:hypothetical protein